MTVRFCFCLSLELMASTILMPRAPPPPRSRHEELRRQRLAEFMDGFGQITLRLKEMYQVGEQTAQYPYRQSGGCYSQRQYCTVL